MSDTEDGMLEHVKKVGRKHGGPGKVVPVSEKAMPWALELARAIEVPRGFDPGGTHVFELAVLIQRVAEPLLAVVRAVKRSGWSSPNAAVDRCGICGAEWPNHEPHCPVPAALAAMEVDGE